MRANTMQPYHSELEAQMRAFYWSLSEKDRRRYAAIEAAKLGFGGFTYLAQVFGCDRHPFAHGQAELNDPATLAAHPRGRRRTQAQPRDDARVGRRVSPGAG